MANLLTKREALWDAIACDDVLALAEYQQGAGLIGSGPKPRSPRAASPVTPVGT